MLAEDKKQLIENTGKQTEEELLVQLGNDIVTNLFAAPPPRQVLKNKAIEWLQSKHNEIQEAVCSAERVRSALENDEDILLVAAISDVIAGLCLGVSPVTVAVLLTKRGIGKICAPIWSKTNHN